MTPEFNPSNIRVVVGLGNPGSRYARTYHNAGRIVAHALEAHNSLFAPRVKFITPDTYMNESGHPVKRALRTKPDTLLLIHDDVDLPLGSYRLSFGRGAGGHHGVESVIHALGTKEFWRLRVGVRPSRAPQGKIKADAIVLRPMSKTAEAAIKKAIEDFIERHAREEG